MQDLLLEGELQRLSALKGYGILDTPQEGAFDDIARLASQICGTPIALVTLIDQTRQWFKAGVGVDIRELPRSQSFCQYTIPQTELMMVPDARQDTRFAALPFVSGAPGIRFYAGVPLVVPGGHVIGTLCVLDTVPRELSESQRQALVALSRQVVAQLELRRQRAELERRITEGQSVQDLLRDNERQLREITDNVPSLIARVNTQARYVFANRAYQEFLHIPANEVVGRTMSEVLGQAAYRAVRPYVARALAGETVVYETQMPFRTIGPRMMRVSYVPERDADGGVTGFVLSSTDITEREALLTETERLLAEAVERADRDPLTGLLNHRAFHKRLEEEADRALRVGTSLAVAMVDLNNFRFFNDAYGHLAGDDVLRRIAGALQRCCRSYDTLARFGGDEFALLVPGLSPDETGWLASRLQSSLDGIGYRPPGYDTEIPLSLAVGTAVFPDESPSRLDVVALADSRLFRVKSGGDVQGESEHLRTALSGSVEGFSMLDALVAAVDNKDRYTRRHSEDVLAYSLQIAEGLGLDEATRHTVAVAALLHDVGKIGVPDAILRKPGLLSDAEFEAIKQHPMMGAIMVGAVPGFEGTLDAVRHHHERWDGGGYPFGLSGREIPLLARLMAVADAFSAMTTDRPYRKGMEAAKAMEILQAGAGGQWDPECVQAFLAARTGTSLGASVPR